MDKGIDFLKSQVSNAVMSHKAFVDALKDHEGQADDPRFRDLCSRYRPIMQEMQGRLEEYQKELGADAGMAKKVMGSVASGARDLADAARSNDFLRLVGDIVLSDQNEDTFRTFREAGRQLGNQRLQEIGASAEQQHDNYNRDANRLVQSMFVELVRGTERAASAQAQTGTQPRPAV
jgi:hypothetical protein